jgi:predicted XRE-type DNA-binding protein
MPQPPDYASLDSIPLRGALLTTGGDDCPTQAEKLPNKPATVTNTTHVQTHAELKQRMGTRGLGLNRPRVYTKAKIKQYTGSLDLKKASGINNQGL